MDQDIPSMVFQYKITLKDIRPPIWRRIQVPAGYNFKELHFSIQCAMGWYNTHLYEFRIRQVGRFGVDILHIGDPPTESYLDNFGPKTIDAKTQKLSSYFPHIKSCHYEYDFGDGWEHRVELEKVLPKKEGVTYPICLAGKRGCPPENVGSIRGYYRHLEIIKNPQHPEYKEHMSWFRRNQTSDDDPEKFDPKSVEFDFIGIDRELFYAQLKIREDNWRLTRLFQLKVTLCYVRPKIWRTIQIPGDCTFKELHLAIKHAMGWDNSQSYDFQVRQPGKYELLYIVDLEDPIYEDFDRKSDASSVKLAEYFEHSRSKCHYDYDVDEMPYGYKVELENILDKAEGATYPICIAGSRNCLPKNVGDTSEYLTHLKILSDPQHPEHKQYMKWFAVQETCERDSESVDFDFTTVNYNCELFSAYTEHKIIQELQNYIVFQLKITLNDVSPPVWRSIQVPGDFTFEELHYAIQFAMGWKNCHQYEFRVKEEGKYMELHISNVDPNFSILGPKTYSTKVKVANYFRHDKAWCTYEYDFESFWKHRVELERIFPKGEGEIYPVCIAGSGFCPPENVGGMDGYKKHLEILQNPNHPEYKEHMEWFETNTFEDPETFDPKSVDFEPIFEERRKQELYNEKIKQLMSEYKNKHKNN